MSEAGGPSTQSGIFYQNSIAALYLGRLCAPREEAESEQVSAVRVEAPTEVDDIVVSFLDAHREFVQAKERLEKNGKAWPALWQALLAQSRNLEPGDVLRIVVGESSALCSRLREMSGRAGEAQSVQEWVRSLNSDMNNELAAIREVLPPGTDERDVWTIFARLKVSVIELENIISDRAIPNSNRPKEHLLSVLRDKAAAGARYRKVFHAPELLTELETTDKVQITESTDGLTAYRDAVERLYDELGLPGTTAHRKTLSVFVWPTTVLESDSKRAFDRDEDELPTSGAPVDLRTFPDEGPLRAAVVAGGGFGKTSLLTALARSRARSRWVPAFVALPELARSERPLLEYLETVANTRLSCSVAWRQLASSGHLVLLLDGLDELASEKRHRVLTSIREFSARFPLVPWLLTTRDARTLAGSPGVAVLRMAALDWRAIGKFCEAYLAGTGVNPAVFAERVRTSRDLNRMARVPLLLAIMLEFHLQYPSRILPNTRSMLLENYLDIVLDPRTHRPTTISTAPSVLRSLAERAALQSLQAPAQPLLVGASRSELALACSTDLDTALDNLVACGVARKEGKTLRFSVPIVQEFLAGKLLALRSTEELSALFESASTRPWAETLSFALDEHPNAEQILVGILSGPDDAFHSRLRIAGRCIANGATVSAATRQRIGDALGAIWRGSEHGVLAHQVAEIMAAGFADPLPDDVREALRTGHGIYNNSGLLLSAANDAALTLESFRAILDSSRILVPDESWKAALARVALPAWEALAQAARKAFAEKNSAKRIEVAAFAFKHAGIPEELRTAFEIDTAIALSARVHVCNWRQAALPEYAADMVDATFRQYPIHWGIVDGGLDAKELLWKLDDAVGKWRSLVTDARVDESVRCALVFSILEFRPESEALTELKALWTILQDPMSRQASLLARAAVGDEQAMDAASRSVLSFGTNLLYTWIRLTSNFPASADVAEGLRRLAPAWPLLRESIGVIAPTLDSAMTHVARVRDLGVGQAPNARNEHPLKPAVAAMLWDWSRQPSADLDEQLTLLNHAASLGHGDAHKELLACIAAIAASLERTTITQDQPIGHSLATALETMGDSVSAQHHAMFAQQPHSRLQSSCIRILGAHGTRFALDALIELLPKLTSYFRELALDEAERVALALGVKVVQTSSGYRVVESG